MGKENYKRGLNVAGVVGVNQAVDLMCGNNDLSVILAAPVKSSRGTPPPLRKSPGAAGYDLSSSERVTIWPGQQKLVGTGWALVLPLGFCATIWPRSGLALNNRIDRNAGLIDSDYRGEIKVMLVNNGDRPVTFEEGDRIAQLKLEPLFAFDVYRTDELPCDTERGDQGFGSTGAK